MYTYTETTEARAFSFEDSEKLFDFVLNRIHATYDIQPEGSFCELLLSTKLKTLFSNMTVTTLAKVISVEPNLQTIVLEIDQLMKLWLRLHHYELDDFIDVFSVMADSADESSDEDSIKLLGDNVAEATHVDREVIQAVLKGNVWYAFFAMFWLHLPNFLLHEKFANPTP